MGSVSRTPVRRGGCLAVLAGVATPAAGQCGTNWELRAAVGPAGRTSHAMAYDSARGRVVLFGGWSNGGALGDTWEWDGTTWTRRFPPVSPPARRQAAVTYDGARGRVVLFGGYAAVSSVGDTWEWDGAAGTWTQRAPAVSPSARLGAAMAFDSARGRCVLFGGQGSAGGGGETWEWDGTSWVLTATTGPEPRYDHGMAFDPSRARIVLPDGWGGATWEYDGIAWVMRPGSPAVGSRHLVVFDPVRGRIISAGRVYGGGWQTWEFDPSGPWVQIGSSGPPSDYGAMAYDTGRLRGVHFGGQTVAGVNTETWEWDGAFSGGPAIHTQPQSIVRDPGQTAVLTVVAVGNGSLSYQWLRGGGEVSNGPTGTGATISGATTDTLTITNVGVAVEGLYSCRITDTCGPTTSVVAAVQVACYGNCDWSTVPPRLNVMDFICFQSKYAAGDSYANCDGSTAAPILNVNDFICFQNSYAQGCQ